MRKTLLTHLFAYILTLLAVYLLHTLNLFTAFMWLVAAPLVLMGIGIIVSRVLIKIFAGPLPPILDRCIGRRE
jgi:hypothetical protein